MTMSALDIILAHAAKEQKTEPSTDGLLEKPAHAPQENVRHDDPSPRPWAPTYHSPSDYDREYYDDPKRLWSGDCGFLHEGWKNRSPEERVEIIRGRWPDCPTDLVRLCAG